MTGANLFAVYLPFESPHRPQEAPMTTPTPTTTRKLTNLDSEQGMLVFLAALVLLSVIGVIVVGG